MTLTRCPNCGTQVAADDAACAPCGEDLVDVRAELDRLMGPSVLWTGRPVIPLDDLRHLTPERRRLVMTAVRLAITPNR